MKKRFVIVLIFLLSLISSSGQTIEKPRGCFAGTNGFGQAVISHPEVRGVLLAVRWSNIEVSPGVFDFTSLNSKIDQVEAAGLKFTIAITAGATGSPDWLIDDFGVDFISYMFREELVKLPFWWDPIVQNRLEILITELGIQYSQNTSLSHVYVSQMTSNGIEGHLNALDMNLFIDQGYTDQKWIDAAKWTATKYADAFPDIPIVFEIHNINQDTVVPTTIINDLYEDPQFCQRVGLAMWWISGKTDYQGDLLDFIFNYQGDKYAQVIGRSDQLERFKDSLYENVFIQAKQLGIQYIEPWPYEFINHTHDSLFHDFNLWSDSQFPSSDACEILTISTPDNKKIIISPNPFNKETVIKFENPNRQPFILTLYSFNGKLINRLDAIRTNRITLKKGNLSNGLYFIQLKSKNKTLTGKLIME